MNNLEYFEKYCSTRGITLTASQKDVVKQLYTMPVAGGKSLLISLLFDCDRSAEMYSNMYRQAKFIAQ